MYLGDRRGEGWAPNHVGFGRNLGRNNLDWARDDTCRSKLDGVHLMSLGRDSL